MGEWKKPNFDFLQAEFKKILQETFDKGDINDFESKVQVLKATELDIKGPLDQAFRDFVLDVLETETSNVARLKSYIEFAIESCRRHLNSPTIPVVLLGDIFDALTLDHCQEMFPFVEQNVQVWKEELFFTACKNNLLRLCNDLLRRLSRTTATVFCGKILLFLAKFFPFSERSGLNIVSEFNLENITEYGTEPTDDLITETQTEESKQFTDYSFYCKFWQLQDFFRNPNQCYDKVQWKVFCSHSGAILNAFQGIKLDYVASEQSSSVGYFAKYLTSQKLLDLQLHDVGFRRAVLVQFLIVFQYLTSIVKFKSDSYELKSDQKEWLQSSQEKVYSLLRETPPDGENFATVIRNILKREELWNSWKNDGCPEIKKYLPQMEQPVEPVSNADKNKPLLGDIIKESMKDGKYYMGSGELTKLWNNCPNNLEACKGRDFLPSLEEFFEDAIAQSDGPKPIKDEDNVLKDSNFGWRALRLLARRSPYFFSITMQNNLLSRYLELMVHKIAHEKPGKNNMDESSQEGPGEQEMEEVLQEHHTEDLKQTEDFVDDSNPRRDTRNISVEKIQTLAEAIAPHWEKLAVKLSYKPDEIEWFKHENPDRVDQCKHMLGLWFEDDEDASLDNLLYILEGLDMADAAETVRNEINGASQSIMDTT